MGKWKQIYLLNQTYSTDIQKDEKVGINMEEEMSWLVVSRAFFIVM